MNRYAPPARSGPVPRFYAAWCFGLSILLALPPGARAASDTTLAVPAPSTPPGAAPSPAEPAPPSPPEESRGQALPSVPPPPAPPPGEIKPAEVTLLCPPGSEVFIDGQLTGLERGRATLPPGRYKAGCGPSEVADAFEIDLTLRSGDQRELDFSRKRRAETGASMTVRCPAGQPVFIDNRLQGIEQVVARVAPGKHRVRCGGESGASALEQEVDVRKGDLNTFDFNLPGGTTGSSATGSSGTSGTGSSATSATGSPGTSGTGSSGTSATGSSSGPATGSSSNPTPPPLSREQVFERSAPATVFLVTLTNAGIGLGSGAIVDPAGLVVTNRHVIEGQGSSARVFAFLFDPDEGSLPDDVEEFMRTHREKAIEVQVVRTHPNLDLALVQLPRRPQPYPALPLGDIGTLRIGQEVAAIGNPRGLTWTLTTGTVSQLRKGAIQHQAPINPGNSGGPLLNLRGELVGINTRVANEIEARGSGAVAIGGLGFAIPVNEVSSFLSSPPPGPVEAAPRSAPGDDWRAGFEPEAFETFVAEVLEQLMPGATNTLPHTFVADMLHSMALDGNGVFTLTLDGGQLTAAIARGLAALTPAQAATMNKVVSHTWPRLVVDAQNGLWVRTGIAYRYAAPAVAWDVDDVNGNVFFVEPSGKAFLLDDKQWMKYEIGLEGVDNLEATDGVVYAALKRGGLVAVSPKGRQQLTTSTLSGVLLGTKGHLYYLDPDSSLYHYHGGWEADGKAVVQGIHGIAANGADWYGLDAQKRVYSGRLGKYIDTDGDATGLWMLGEDPLIVTRGLRLFTFDAQTQRWRELKE